MAKSKKKTKNAYMERDFSVGTIRIYDGGKKHRLRAADAGREKGCDCRPGEGDAARGAAGRGGKAAAVPAVRRAAAAGGAGPGAGGAAPGAAAG